MTVKEMIAKLEELALVVGEDARVAVFDEYEANEGWGEGEVWCEPSIRAEYGEVHISCA